MSKGREEVVPMEIIAMLAYLLADAKLFISALEYLGRRYKK